MTEICNIKHPYYSENSDRWEKYRDVLKSGKDFVDKYLVRYSSLETDTDFKDRKAMTFTPSFAKAALIDIRNAIFQRTPDIRRNGGPKSYLDAISGENSGVDLKGNSMDSFIGRVVLTELLGLSRVGVYIDKPEVAENASRVDTKGIRPYLYTYQAEDICAWNYNIDGQLDALLLCDHVENCDGATGLTLGIVKEYRYLQRINGGVVVKYYDSEGSEQHDREKVLKLKNIPFVLFTLSNSILEDAADYQIALLNLESSDVHFALKANFPFYIEQFSPQADMMHLKGTETEKDQKAGVSKGRRYPQGMDAPAFINPSPDPLEISMKKQEALKADVRRIVNLNVSGLSPSRSSAESKGFDQRGLESGLSYIGMELQYGENQIATIWSEYEGEDPSIIKYPTRYNLVSDDDRIETAKKVRQEMPMVPSLTYQREMAKEVSTQMLGSKVDVETLERVHAEIDKAEVVVTDPEIIKLDHEAGLVSDKTASMARLYDEKEHEQAAMDHAQRAARIVKAQMAVSSDSTSSVDQANGAPDLGVNPGAGKDQKIDSQDPDMDIDGKKGVRS